MKKSILLIVTFLLIFSKLGFGQENSQVSNFNDYVNSSKVSLQNPVDKNVSQYYAAKHKNSYKESLNRKDSNEGLQGVPRQWKACALNSECTAVAADCLIWEPLNKKYLKRIIGNLDSCSKSVDPGFQPETVCVEKECRMTKKSTNVSWEEWLDAIRSKDAIR